MASYNRIVLVGNLTRDPEYKQLSSGQPVCRLSIATNRQFKNRQNGSLVQEVCYIDVDVWGVQAESCKQYLQKGRGVLIEGRLKYDTWEDQQGQTRSKHSVVADRVVFLGSAQQVEEEGAETAAPAPAAGSGGRGATLSDAAGVSQAQQKQMESELNDQIDLVRKRAKLKKEQAPKPAGGGGADDFDFKDQPPFDDELPF